MEPLAEQSGSFGSGHIIGPAAGCRHAEAGRPRHRTRRLRVGRPRVLALIIALLIKTFLFQAFYIPSESMVPTLKVHDRVLVNKLSYRLHPVHRGDIVVFKAPPDSDPGIDDLVKRVIGLPGETRLGRTAVTCTSTASSSTSRISRRARSPPTSRP